MEAEAEASLTEIGEERNEDEGEGDSQNDGCDGWHIPRDALIDAVRSLSMLSLAKGNRKTYGQVSSPPKEEDSDLRRLISVSVSESIRFRSEGQWETDNQKRRGEHCTP